MSKQIHAAGQGTTKCGLTGKAATRNPSKVTCGRCKIVLDKLTREDRI